MQDFFIRKIYIERRIRGIPTQLQTMGPHPGPKPSWKNTLRGKIVPLKRAKEITKTEPITPSSYNYVD